MTSLPEALRAFTETVRADLPQGDGRWESSCDSVMRAVLARLDAFARRWQEQNSDGPLEALELQSGLISELTAERDALRGSIADAELAADEAGFPEGAYLAKVIAKLAAERDALKAELLLLKSERDFLKGFRDEVIASPFHAQLAAAEAARAALRDALKALVTKLDAIHADPRFEAVWTSYHVHGGRYTEPTYTAEFEAAKAALLVPPAGEQP